MYTYTYIHREREIDREIEREICKRDLGGPDASGSPKSSGMRPS